MIRVVYFNGLGNGKPRQAERRAMKLATWHLARHGISVRHVPVDWYAHEPLSRLLDRMAVIVQEELSAFGSVTVCGVSAGGSLAINVFGRLRRPNLSVVVVCGPVRLLNRAGCDTHTLEHLAFRNPARPSQLLYDSVLYCSTTTVPALTNQDKRRMATIQQWVDTVVPGPTMHLPGVRIYRVPGIGHMFGIGAGVWRLPTILKMLSQKNSI